MAKSLKQPAPKPRPARSGGAADPALARLKKDIQRLKNERRKLVQQIAAHETLEKALVHGRDEWQRTFDAVPDLIFLLDKERRITRINRAAAHRLGQTPPELVGRPCYEVVHKTSAPPDFCPHAQMLLDGNEHAAEIYEPRLGGDVAISVTPLRDADGQLTGSVHVARDITVHKAMERSLQRAHDQIQERHALTVAASLDGLWEWELASDRVHYSDRYAQLLGFEPSEMDPTFDFFRSAIHPDDAEGTWQAIERHLSGHEPFDVEHRLRTKSGEYRWFRTRGRAQWDTQGRPVRMAGTAQDITERRTNQEIITDNLHFEQWISETARRAAQASFAEIDQVILQAFRELLDRFHVDRCGLMVFLEDTRFIRTLYPAYSPGVSSQSNILEAARDFPYLRERLLAGETQMVTAETPLPPEAERDIASLRAMGVGANLLVPFSVAGSPIYVVALSTTRSQAAWPPYLASRLHLAGEILVGALLQKTAAESLREAERKYRIVADFTSDWEYWEKPDGSLPYMSPCCERFCGHPAQAFLDHPALLNEIVAPEDRVAWGAHRVKAHERRQPGRMDFRICRRDGTIVWIEHVCQPVVDEKGQFLGIRASNRDITRRKTAEAESRKLRAELVHSERVATLGALTAAIAHEINQPLAAILSNAQAALRLLDRQAPDLGEVRGALQDIADDDRRAGDIVRGLRDMLKKEERAIEVVDVNATLASVAEIVRSEVILRGATLKIATGANPCFIEGDRVQLQQVLLNLVMNALDAMQKRPRGERCVELTTETEALDEAASDNAARDDDARNNAKRGQVVVRVADSGPGIAPDILAAIFKPFFTTKAKRAGIGTSMGLGLAICKRIIEAHGGRLWVENRPQGGAVFSFALPRATAPASLLA